MRDSKKLSNLDAEVLFFLILMMKTEQTGKVHVLTINKKLVDYLSNLNNEKICITKERNTYCVFLAASPLVSSTRTSATPNI